MQLVPQASAPLPRKNSRVSRMVKNVSSLFGEGKKEREKGTGFCSAASSFILCMWYMTRKGSQLVTHGNGVLTYTKSSVASRSLTPFWYSKRECHRV